MKRVLAVCLSLIILICCSDTVVACDEEQSNAYVLQVLFGDRANSFESDENVKILLDALYLCSEQTNGLGQEKIDYLKKKRVSGVPALANIDILEKNLHEYAHNSWEYEYTAGRKVQNNRKKILRNSVNKVFDFGTFNNWFGSNDGKCNSFSALLYYSHILADYLADTPSDTEFELKGNTIPSFSGVSYTELNGNKPSFTPAQKRSTESFASYSNLDSYGRAGVAFANIGFDSLRSSDDSIGGIRPSGWNQKRYEGLVNSSPPFLFNRCHLIARRFSGENQEINLITGTRYFNNEGMLPWEDKVAKYINETKNHVLYRVTPVYRGDNLVASGVQMEAFSVEDNGKGICFNIYVYNVQSGVEINYATGESQQSDSTLQSETIIPFALYGADEEKPDLMYEMSKHIEILLIDQKNSRNYTSLKSDLDTIARDARNVDSIGDNQAQKYMKLKSYQYKYLETLKTYLPGLLAKEDFFKSAFK